MNILIVDDHEENRYLLEALLKGNGHDVRLAANGAEALEGLKAGVFELVISDILMPVMDGFQLCRKVKTDEALRHIPFIVYTATYTGPQDEAFAIKIGADRFIQKPCEPEAFMKVVDDLMAAARRCESASKTAPAPEEEILKLYSERLVRKLEQKMFEAESEIKARQEAEEALRISNTRLHLALASANIGLWDWNFENDEIWFSPEWKRQMGYDDHELPNRKEEWENRLHPEDRPRILAEIGACRQGLRPDYHVEFRLRHKEGMYRWFAAYGKLIPGAGEKNRRFMGCQVDITERKRSDTALRESEERYRILVEESLDGIFLQKGPRITFANKRLYEMLGYEGGELEGMEHWRIYHPSYQEMTKARAQARLRGEEAPSHYEAMALRKDGSAFYVELGAKVIRVEGEPGIQVLVRDVTEHKRAEAERERLMAAIEQAGEIVFITDADGTIQYVNPAFETATGYTREEAIGRNPRMLKSGEQDQAFYQDLWGTITSGKTWKGRIVNKRKDGKSYTVDATISPVCDASGRVVNYVAVKRDITEHLRLEAQLFQSQKMESVGQLAGGVAHDYNNMLSVILGYAELAMAKVNPADTLRNDLQQILKAAKRSTDITRQLLTFARKQTIAPEVLDLNETVEGSLKMLRRLMGEDIDLVWLPETDLWLVKMDPVQVDQILANLCVNARDAIAGVGKVNIETRNVAFDEAYCDYHTGFVPGEFVLLSVSDDGCGMNKEIQDKIFEPFFTTKGPGQGTGLGLATVYGIVKQNSGFINVYSEPGKGTTFKIYLPRHAGEAKEQKAEVVVEIPKGRGEIVLVVEDEVSILRLTNLILDGLGYNVLTAKTPGEAIALAGEHAGELNMLITDMVMPEMNGRDLAEQLQGFCPDIKTLFMSGYAAGVIVHRGELEEGIHFIQKPFSMKDLAIKVRDVLDG